MIYQRTVTTRIVLLLFRFIVFRHIPRISLIIFEDYFLRSPECVERGAFDETK